jgi:uncharacterized protein YerC
MAAKGRTVTKHGSEHPNAKLTESQVIEIRELISNGNTYRTIADKFHVSTFPIARIARGEGWNHVRKD